MAHLVSKLADRVLATVLPERSAGAPCMPFLCALRTVAVPPRLVQIAASTLSATPRTSATMVAQRASRRRSGSKYLSSNRHRFH